MNQFTKLNQRMFSLVEVFLSDDLNDTILAFIQLGNQDIVAGGSMVGLTWWGIGHRTPCLNALDHCCT